MLSKSTIGIKELQSFNIGAYDMDEVEDKKTKELKGIFISNQYADIVKEYLEKLDKEKTKKIEGEFEAICGIGSIGDANIKDLLKDKYCVLGVSWSEKNFNMGRNVCH